MSTTAEWKGAAGTRSHSLGTQGAVEGQRTEEVRGHREKAEEGQRKKRKNQVQRREAGEVEGEGARPWSQVPGALSKPAESSPMKGPKKKKGVWKSRSVSCKGTEPGEELDLPALGRGDTRSVGAHLSREEVTIPAYPAVISLKGSFKMDGGAGKPSPRKAGTERAGESSPSTTYSQTLFRA